MQAEGEAENVTKRSTSKFSGLFKKKTSLKKTPLPEIYERAFNLFIKNQNSVTGLIPSANNPDVASVHDNVYAALSLWCISMAFSKNARYSSEHKKTSNNFLRQSKKLMLAVLAGFEAQVKQKDEAYFKHFPGVDPFVHLDLSTGRPMENSGSPQINQSETGPTKIETVAFFLLILALMQATGFKIVQSVEEVSVIQNLIIYLQSIYFRVDTDVDSIHDQIKFDDSTMRVSAVAMIKGALDAYNLLNIMTNKQLFGIYTIQAFHYETIQARLLLKHLVGKVLSLKWFNPNVACLTSFPCFAVRNQEKKEIIEKALIGKYVEQSGKQSVPGSEFNKDKFEVHMYLCLSSLFSDNQSDSHLYKPYLDHYMSMPMENFYKIFEESTGMDNSFSYFTCQSLYILISLLADNYLSVKDIDALSMYTIDGEVKEKVNKNKEIHVVLLTESRATKAILKKNNIPSQLLMDVGKNYKIFSDDVLQNLLVCLACDINEELRTLSRQMGNPDPTSRPTKEVISSHNPSNIMYCAQLYSLRNYKLMFIPRIMERHSCYLNHDIQMYCDLTISNLKFISRCWLSDKHPLYFLPVHNFNMSEGSPLPADLERLFKKIKSGLVGGVRVKLAKMPKSTDMFVVNNLDLLANNKSDAKEKLTILSTLSEYSYNTIKEKGRSSNTIPVTTSVAIPPSNTAQHHPSTSNSTNYQFTSNDFKKVESEPMKPHATIAATTTSGGGGASQLLGKTSAGVTTTVNARKSNEKSEATEATTSQSISVPQPAHTFPSANSHNVVGSSSGLNEVIKRLSTLTTTSSFSKVVLSGYSVENFVPSGMFGHHEQWELKWRKMDLNWLPEQIADFVISTTDMNDAFPPSEEECIQLLRLFDSSSNFMEKAHILHKLYYSRGINWRPAPETPNYNGVTLRGAITEMYRMSGLWQIWWMLRFSAGVIGAHLDNLSVALSDIVTRRHKQVIIGCTPNNKIVIAKPHRDLDIISIIHIVSRNNPYMISLLQEILVYVWMIYQFNPVVVDQLVCIDVQAIYQAMITDLCIRFDCNEMMGSVYLACLSPFELKCFIEVTLRGNEITKAADIFELGKNLARHKDSGFLEHIDIFLQQGLWLKRRSMDGVLMRLPDEFIENVWDLLKICKGLTYEGHLIKSETTDKYSKYNLNFTAVLYATLRLVKPPEFLQLLIEATYLLSTLAKSNRLKMDFKKVINVNEVVTAAVNLFLRHQHSDKAKTCCIPSKNIRKPSVPVDAMCKLRGGICYHFYDSCPTGEFGTMAYFTDAILALYTDVGRSV